MFCWNCGTKLSNEARFCFSCGSPTGSEKNATEKASPVKPAPDLELTRIMPSKQENSTGMELPDPYCTESEPQFLFSAPTPQVLTSNEPKQKIAPVPTVISDEEQPKAPTPPIILNGESKPRTAPTSPVLKDNNVKDDTSAPTVSKKSKTLGRKSKSAVRTVILSLVFGLFIFLFGITSALGLIIRTTLSEAEISKAVSESDMSEIIVGDIISDTGISDSLIEGNFISKPVDSETTISDLISENTDFSSRKAEELLENSFLTAYVGNIISAYEIYILNNIESDIFSGDEIYKIIEDNIDGISDIAGMEYVIYEEELHSATEYIDEYISMLAPENALNGKGGLTSFLLSPVILISLAVVVLIFAVLIGVTTSDASAAILTSGICTLLAGGVLVLASGLKNKIMSLIGLDYKIFTDYVSDILSDTICLRLESYGLIILAAGAVIIVAAVIIKIIASVIRKNKTA